MSEVDPRKQIRKVRDKFFDFSGKERSEEEYLAQFAAQDDPNVIEGSGIPGEKALLEAGMVTLGDVIENYDSLTGIPGIGKKTAEDIVSFLDELAKGDSE